MTPSERTALGQWIRESRKRVKWTQAALGRLFDVSQATVSMWERGKAEPGEHELQEMQRIFGSPEQQLGLPQAGEADQAADASPPSAKPGKASTGSQRGKRRRKTSTADGGSVTTDHARETYDADAGRPQHAELLRQLWEAAVNLRGSIEPADYKRYVLPIIFLRFLSVRFEQRRVDLADEIREPTSPYFAESEEEAEFVLEDDDSYRSANVFPVPAAARWEELRKHAQADDIKIRLDRALEALEVAYPLKLKGLLPRVFAGSNLSRENVTGLINLFSRDVFSVDHGGADVLGQVYEYFIGEFADSEGKRGGEYFTPVSIVRTLVAMLEPERGVVFDPCCGSGGMFVQADEFTKHSRRLSFYGQESKDFTYRLCRMNLFIHGLDGDIQLGNSYLNDQHATVRADYVLANPPFNDGSKSEQGWGADRVPDKDPRLELGLGSIREWPETVGYLLQIAKNAVPSRGCCEHHKSAVGCRGESQTLRLHEAGRAEARPAALLDSPAERETQASPRAGARHREGGGCRATGDRHAVARRGGGDGRRPYFCPTKLKRSRAPQFHAIRKRVRRAMREAYAWAQCRRSAAECCGSVGCDERRVRSTLWRDFAVRQIEHDCSSTGLSGFAPQREPSAEMGRVSRLSGETVGAVLG